MAYNYYPSKDHPPHLITYDGIQWYHTTKTWGPQATTWDDSVEWKKIPAPDTCHDCSGNLEKGEEVWTQNYPAYRKTLCMTCVRRRGYIW